MGFEEAACRMIVSKVICRSWGFRKLICHHCLKSQLSSFWYSQKVTGNKNTQFLSKVLYTQASSCVHCYSNIKHLHIKWVCSLCWQLTISAHANFPRIFVSKEKFWSASRAKEWFHSFPVCSQFHVFVSHLSISAILSLNLYNHSSA